MNTTSVRRRAHPSRGVDHRLLGRACVLFFAVGQLVSNVLFDVWSPTELQSGFTIESVSHSWLFPRMSATVHHGGAGTTGAAALGGRPMVVVPFGAEQPFWAAQVHHLGVAPPPLLQRRITSERLAAAIQAAVGTPRLRSRAAALAMRLRAEDGIGAAVGD